MGALNGMRHGSCLSRSSIQLVQRNTGQHHRGFSAVSSWPSVVRNGTFRKICSALDVARLAEDPAADKEIPAFGVCVCGGGPARLMQSRDSAVKSFTPE